MIAIVPCPLPLPLGLEAHPDTVAVVGGVIKQARGVRIRQISVQFGLTNCALEVADSPHVCVVCLNERFNTLSHSDQGTLQCGDRRGVRDARNTDSRGNN